MTEVPDLSFLFGQQQQAEPPPEVRRHLRKMARLQRDAELLAYYQVQFFAPVLCNCDKRYVWGEPRPPQSGCVVHGHMQVDAQTGLVLMFRPPKEW